MIAVLAVTNGLLLLPSLWLRMAGLMEVAIDSKRRKPTSNRHGCGNCAARFLPCDCSH